MLSSGRYPEYDEPDFEDEDWSVSRKPDPFGRHEHALQALRVGDLEIAILTMAECAVINPVAQRLAEEAAHLLRAGRVAEAELLLTRAAQPKFSSVRAARSAYGAAMADCRHRRLAVLLHSHGLEFAP